MFSTKDDTKNIMEKIKEQIIGSKNTNTDSQKKNTISNVDFDAALLEDISEDLPPISSLSSRKEPNIENTINSQLSIDNNINDNEEDAPATTEVMSSINESTALNIHKDTEDHENFENSLLAESGANIESGINNITKTDLDDNTKEDTAISEEEEEEEGTEEEEETSEGTEEEEIEEAEEEETEETQNSVTNNDESLAKNETIANNQNTNNKINHNISNVATGDNPAQEAIISDTISSAVINNTRHSIEELMHVVKQQIQSKNQSTQGIMQKTIEEFLIDLIEPKINSFLEKNLVKIVDEAVKEKINKIVNNIL